MQKSATSALMALALIITPSLAHSWVEQMMVIAPNGSFTGNPGYARNNTMRTVPGFSDLLMVHILPGQGQPSIEERQAPSPAVSAPAAGTSTAFSDTMSILPTDPMCKKTQQTQMQSNGSPRLQAAPGANIALRYQENGHVTLPQNQPGKQANRGTVYIYGTTQPKTDEIFLDVFKQWNAAGTGGDKRGVLLATQPFDDGRCYQVNSGNISSARQTQYPHQANQLMGANLWCQNDMSLPADAPSGQPYTLYWVWDWPTMPGVDPNLPNGKAEIYTTCMDIDIQGTSANKARRDLDERQAPAAPSAAAASGLDLNNYAIPKYMAQLASPGVQSAQAAQATPASPMAPTNAAQSATDAQAASGFMSYLSTAVGVEPSAGVCSAAAAAPVTVTVTPPAVTVYASAESPTTMATVVLPTLTATVTTSGVASVSVPAGTQAAAQAPAPVASSPAQAAPSSLASNSAQGAPQAASPTPATVASSPAQAPAPAQPTSIVTVFSTSIIPVLAPTVQAGSQIPAPVTTSSSTVYMASTPVQVGSQVASPSPNTVASSPAQAPAQSQPTTYSTTSSPPSIPPTVLVFAPPVTSGTPPPLTPVTSASSAASPTPLIPSVASNIANELSFTGTTSAATSSAPLSVANAISFSGTASAIPLAPTLSSSYQSAASSSGFPAPYQNTSTPSKSCSMNKCKLKKRSLLLDNHVHRH